MSRLPWILHDLISGSYFVEALHNETKGAHRLEPAEKWSDFQVDAIRRRGTR